MIGLDIDSEVKKLQRKLLADVKHVKPALSATLNRMGSAVRMQGGNELAKVMGISGAKVRKSLKLFRSRVATLTARVWARGRPFNLRTFKGTNWKRNKKVIGVKASPWGVKRNFRRGFVLNVPGKPIVIWKGKKLTSMYGPGIGKESQRQAIINIYNKIVLMTFRKRFNLELRRRMTRGKRSR